jgi:hypothetical protein
MRHFDIKIVSAWWLTPLLYAIAIASGLMGRKPEPDTIEYWIERAMRPTLVRK